MSKSYQAAWLATLICVAIFGTQAAAAQSADAARRFLEGVYALYDAGGPDMMQEGAKAIVVPELLQDMKKLQTLSAGDSTPLQESDPICNCQDYEDIKVSKIDIKLLPENRAEAKVFYRNMDSPFEREFILEWVKSDTNDNGRWLIYDIKTPEYQNGVTSFHQLVRQDIIEVEKYRAEQGDAKAQFALGMRYSDDDEEEAGKWIRKAAEQGYLEAQRTLAWMYSEGRGVAYDNAEAVHWYRKAAEQGDANAQDNLSSAYANGKGVGQDGVTAYMWAVLAVNGTAQDSWGYSNRVAFRDELAGRLTPSEIADAVRRVEAWQAQPEICFVENNPVDVYFQEDFGIEIFGFDAYPQDMRCFMAYAVECEHFAGEEPYDEERSQYLLRAVNKYCPAAQTQHIALKKKYAHNADMLKVLSAYDR